VTLIIALLLVPLVILTACFSLEVVAGLRTLPNEHARAASSSSAVIVVPAHDEASILRDRLTALKAAAEGRARILLVADNCADATADIGRRLGIEVIERNDPERRGKGFALDFAREHLMREPPETVPEVVIVIDADCTTDGESLTRLIDRCIASGNPCQAKNIQVPAADSSPAVQLSTFAFFVKNVIRQRGMQRLAGRGHLLGTGMAFPWRIFENAELASGELVEDMKLGQDLAAQGHGSIFVEEAQVSSGAESDRNTLSQRQRWEGGFLRNALRVGPSLLAQAVAKGDRRAIWAAVNLMIPPIALLVVLDIVGIVSAGAIAWLTGTAAWPALVLAALLAIAFMAIALAWRGGGSRYVPLRTLASVPFYLVWKVPLYLGLARTGAPKHWLRTARDD